MHFDWTSSSRHCSSAAEIFHFRLIRIHSNARNSIFHLHHAVHNMSKKSLGLFWQFRPSTSNYNDTLYYNLEKKVKGWMSRENELKLQRLRDWKSWKSVFDVTILSCNPLPSAMSLEKPITNPAISGPWRLHLTERSESHKQRDPELLSVGFWLTDP